MVSLIRNCIKKAVVLERVPKRRILVLEARSLKMRSLIRNYINKIVVLERVRFILLENQQKPEDFKSKRFGHLCVQGLVFKVNDLQRVFIFQLHFQTSFNLFWERLGRSVQLKDVGIQA